MNRILPIGSIVKLEKGFEPLMIIGYKIVDVSNEKKIYDYLGCPYPIGVLDSKVHLLFCEKDIKEIIYFGYNNKEFLEISNYIQNFENKQDEISSNMEDDSMEII